MRMNRDDDAGQTKAHTRDRCGNAASPTVGNGDKGNEEKYQNAAYAEDSKGRDPPKRLRGISPAVQGLASRAVRLCQRENEQVNRKTAQSVVRHGRSDQARTSSS